MDANLELRAASAGNLTGDATLTAVPLTPMDKPLYLHILVPSVSTSDTLVMKAKFRNSGGTTILETYSKSISAAGHYAIPIFSDDPAQYDLSVVLDTTANNSEAVNFGAVVVWVSNSRES